MKKILFLAILTIAGVMQMQAQIQKHKTVKTEVKVLPTSDAENYPEIKFDTLAHDFGTFSKNSPIVKCVFNFTNVGTQDLVINQAFASCGCTVPTYTKDPVKPGERGQIEVTYNGTDKFPGRFKKTISIRYNSPTDEVVRLTISGNME